MTEKQIGLVAEMREKTAIGRMFKCNGGDLCSKRVVGTKQSGSRKNEMRGGQHGPNNPRLAFKA